MALIEVAKFPTAIATEADMLNHKNGTPSNTTPVTLAAQMLSTATTATLATGTGAQLPADNFMISVDDEIMFVGSRTGDALSSITRAAEGTTATLHALGASVYARITAKAHNQIVSEVNAIEAQLGVNLANVVKTSAVGANSGVASLDSGGHLPSAQLPTTVGTERIYGAVNITAVTKNAAVTTDQVLMTQNIGANDWDVLGRAFRIRCGGIISGQASATSVTLKLAIAGVVSVVTFPIQVVTGLSSAAWFIDTTVIRTATGITGKTGGWGEAGINTLSGAGRALNATWDGTVAQVLQCIATFNTSSTSNSITQEMMLIEQVTP